MTRIAPVIPALTGLRGIAAWWVVFYHFKEIFPSTGFTVFNTVLNDGFLAVDLFFVLSGFIISLNYSNRFETFSWREYGHFLGLRLGRIYPLHLFMMIVFLLNPLAITLASHQHAVGNRYGAAYYAMSVVLIQNWGFTDSLAWNVPAWSISAEWFAYLVFPCIAILGRWASTIWRAIAGLLISIIILHYVIQLARGDIAQNGLLRCLLEFLAGNLVYRLSQDQIVARTFVSRGAMLFCLVLIAAMVVFQMPSYPISALAWSALIFGLIRKDGIFSRFLSLSPVVWIGEYSYSTYLVHYFVRDWIKFAMAGSEPQSLLWLTVYVLATAICSFFLYRLIEVPGRRFVRNLVNGRGTPSLAGGAPMS